MNVRAVRSSRRHLLPPHCERGVAPASSDLPRSKRLELEVLGAPHPEMVQVSESPLRGVFPPGDAVPARSGGQIDGLHRDRLIRAQGEEDANLGVRSDSVPCSATTASRWKASLIRADRVDAHGPDEGIEDALVEVPFPHCHLAHRSGRVPGLLVDSLRGHRVVDIADRAHAGQQRDGITARRFG